MKISLSWLRDYLRTDQTTEQLAETLTRSGLEVESIQKHGAAIAGVVAAQILESIQHPNADRLSVCKVDDGSGTPRQIVCGAKNYQAGDKVLLAQPGALLPGDFKIKVGKLRGVESEGMMCSAKELGLGEGSEGLLILPAETPVGTELAILFPPEEILEIEITPNRPDWLGHLGVAREAAAFGAGNFIGQAPAAVSTTTDQTVACIMAPENCTLYSVRRLEGVRVGPSPEWLRRRLEAIGLRSINNVVDVTNYVMFETGQPLHAFDAATIQGPLTVRFAQRGETLATLDGKTYQLGATDLVIAGEKTPLALAGIIGGIASSVTTSTSTILLESALFDPAIIHRTARSLGISTDSSYRFERGAQAQTALAASARAAELIVELSGGQAAKELVIAGTIPAPIEVGFRHERCRALLGIPASDTEIDALLHRLGLIKAGESWKIPGWRNDLTREIDLIEEVARLYGIESITLRLTSLPSPSSEADRTYDFAMSIRRRLAAQGFFEARTGTLIGSVSDLEALAPPPLKVLKVRNPMGAEQSVLRPNLLTGLLSVLKLNLRHGAESIRLFELGRIFQATTATTAGQQEEKQSLTLIMTGRAGSVDWRGEANTRRPLDLFDLKGTIDQLVPGSCSLSYRPLEKTGWPLALEILCAGEPCGYLGLLAPAEARKLMLTGQQGIVVIAELYLAPLQLAVVTSASSLESGAEEATALPKFPGVTRDLALIVESTIPYAVVEKSIWETGEELLKSFFPFDVFSDPTGERISATKKSLAISLTFQDPDRTLTAEEVTAACERIVTKLRESTGAEVRS